MKRLRILETTTLMISLLVPVSTAVLAWLFIAPFSVNADERVSCISTGSTTDMCRIDEPKVTQPMTEYPNIRFQLGDRVIVDAGGCVQTGGLGKTWKRYVDPRGDNSDRLYHGLIQIPGVMPTLVRIQSMIRLLLPPIPQNTDPAQLFLRLGYEDDNYSDNGYYSPDVGNPLQCPGGTDAEIRRAFVILSIAHHLPNPQDNLFNCGPHTLTYIVRSLDNRPGTGIRCVEVNQFDNPIFVWYGEGQWQGQTYRHIGKASSVMPTNQVTLLGYASDLFGNGENFDNNFPGNILIQVVSGNWPVPTEIHATGAWNEAWTLVGSIDYKPLPRPHTCGSYFDEYYVTDLGGTRQGSGLRCVLRTERPTAWFGNGDWGGTTYSHLGILFDIYFAGEFHLGGDASDLCGPLFGEFCNAFALDSLLFSQVSPRGFNVTGAWHENWW
jgi:hypothetical protein